MSVGSVPLATGRVVVVGTLNLDFILQVPVLPGPGQTILATARDQQFGGKGANQAVAAARQGAQVTLLGAVGDDAEGRAYREHLQREGIDINALVTSSTEPTGTAYVYVDRAGENMIVVSAGANATLSAAGLDENLSDANVLLLQNECPLSAVVDSLAAAAARSVRVVLNASPVAADFSWGDQPIDVVIVNEHECAETFGFAAPDALAWSTDASRIFLRERRLNHVIVTCGSEPTLWLSAAGAKAIPTHRIQPVDTVGAGDTFAGAFAARLAAGAEIEAAIWHANVAAALATQAFGAQSAMPGYTRVIATMEAEHSRSLA